MASQDRTLDHYQELMTINATSHVLRTARRLGIFDLLAEGQKTLRQLCDATSLAGSRLSLLLTTLRSIGIIESYGEDFALSSTARLLCQYDRDLGDDVWTQLEASMRETDVDPSESVSLPIGRFNALAATQWIHTPAAMQVAEMLDVGGDASPESPVQTLDIGCGSAVWSCAMAHRDPLMQVTAVDEAESLTSACATAASIDLTSRFETIEGDLLTAPLPADRFDWSVVAQRLHCLAPAQIELVLSRMVAATKTGGKVVVIDSFAGPARPSLAESLEALRVLVETDAQRLPSLAIAQQRMKQAGLDDIQFSYIAASRIGLGMMVGTKT